MMYTTSSAATIRSGRVFSDDWNACAVPWKVPEIESGMWMEAVTFWIALTASPSATPGARLNDSVTAGNCPWWLIDR